MQLTEAYEQIGQPDLAMAALIDAARSSRRERKNSRHELVEKRAGLHEYCEVPASLDRNECLRWCPDGIDE